MRSADAELWEYSIHSFTALYFYAENCRYYFIRQHIRKVRRVQASDQTTQDTSSTRAAQSIPMSLSMSNKERNHAIPT